MNLQSTQKIQCIAQLCFLNFPIDPVVVLIFIINLIHPSSSVPRPGVLKEETGFRVLVSTQNLTSALRSNVCLLSVYTMSQIKCLFTQGMHWSIFYTWLPLPGMTPRSCALNESHLTIQLRHCFLCSVILEPLRLSHLCATKVYFLTEVKDFFLGLCLYLSKRSY